jgi:hypothetical protein
MSDAAVYKPRLTHIRAVEARQGVFESEQGVPVNFLEPSRFPGGVAY